MCHISKYIRPVIYSSISLLLLVSPAWSEPQPSKFKNTSETPAAATAKLERNWWQLFHDAELTKLVESVELDSHNLKIVEARVSQARSQIQAARAAYFPSLDAGLSGRRSQGTQAADFVFPVTKTTTFQAGVDLSYEVDLWGKIRNNVKAAQADFQAGTAAYDGLKLSLQSQVAWTYFMLRAMDGQRETLQKTVASRKDALALTKTKLEAGTGNELDVERAKTELSASEADREGLEQQRNKLENGLALLLGKNASNFKVAAANSSLVMPEIPTGLPSELVQRRPDIHQAAEQLKAANARIGVAKAVYFPSLRLSASAGWEGNEIKRLGEAQSEVNGLGFSFSLPLFDGGRRKSALETSKAQASEAEQSYELVVLTAFQEVEDALSAVRSLTKQRAALDAAVASAQKAVQLSRKRYEGGLVSYFEVIEADRTALVLEQSAQILRGTHYAAVATLIKALGGGWNQPSHK